MRGSTSILFLIGLLTSCTKSKIQSDSIRPQDSLSVIESSYLANDYDSAQIFVDFDSDSLVTEKGGLVEDFISEFRRSGKLVLEHEYGGGDCYGKFKVFVLNNDSLIVDKSSCGEYGFGNSQYLITDNALRLVRKYNFRNHPIETGYSYDVSEEIYRFDHSEVVIKERKKTTKDWRDLYLREIQFENRAEDCKIFLKEFRSELNNLFKL